MSLICVHLRIREKSRMLKRPHAVFRRLPELQIVLDYVIFFALPLAPGDLPLYPALNRVDEYPTTARSRSEKAGEAGEAGRGGVNVKKR